MVAPWASTMRRAIARPARRRAPAAAALLGTWLPARAAARTLAAAFPDRDHVLRRLEAGPLDADRLERGLRAAGVA